MTTTETLRSHRDTETLCLRVDSVSLWWKAEERRLPPITKTIAELNQITREVIGAAIEVHSQLGPGLLESSYRECLCRELLLRAIPFEREKPLPLEYKGIHLGCGYRLDLLVADSVVVEIKAIEALAPIHEAQLLTYLRIGGWRLGLLINFNVAVLKNGIRRRILGYETEQATVPEEAHHDH
ncbi:MAG TPA: GxxExxY protein [Pyrinomonadaceae bacterium]